MNSATRLHATLRRFKNHPGNHTLRHSIATIFSIQDQKSPQIFRSYVNIINLAVDVEEQIRAIPDVNHDLFLRSVSNIQNHLSISNIDGDLGAFQKGLREEDFHGLEFIFDQLDKIEMEVEIPKKELEAFSGKIDDLMKEIRDSKLDPQFSHFLLSNLFTIQTSIKNYQFFGSNGLRNSLSKVIGDIMLDPRDGFKSEETKTLMKKTIDILKDVNILMVFMRNGSEIVNSLKNLKIFQING